MSISGPICSTESCSITGLDIQLLILTFDSNQALVLEPWQHYITKLGSSNHKYGWIVKKNKKKNMGKNDDCIKRFKELCQLILKETYYDFFVLESIYLCV